LYSDLYRGVFLASLVYSEDSKILVTNDDIVPIVEVSEAMSASISTDFVWLASLSCTWEQVEAMCTLSDDYTSSPSVQFRNKLLHAVLDLQHALGISDIGRMHPVPYKDMHGAIVFVAVQYTMDVRREGGSEGGREGGWVGGWVGGVDGWVGGWVWGQSGGWQERGETGMGGGGGERGGRE
jgi:hypothetical protein